MCPRLRRSSLVAAVLAGALLCASPAFSAQDPVIADCIANQQVTGTYTLAQLRHALNTLSPTTKEYTNCYDAINRAIAAKVGGGGNGSSNSSGGSFLPTPLIIVLVVLVLVAGGYGVLAWRRREASGGGDPDGGAGDAGGDAGE